MSKRINGKSLQAGISAYQAAIAAGEFEEVRVGDVRVGDQVKVMSDSYLEVVAIEPVLVGGKRQDFRLTFADGSQDQRYAGMVVTRRPR